MTDHNPPDSITVSRELLRQALEAIELNWKTDEGDAVKPLLRTALEQQEVKPVAWIDREGDVYKELPTPYWCPPHTPLYAAPQAQQPQLLTDEELDGIVRSNEGPCGADFGPVARAIETAVLKKNGVVK